MITINSSIYGCSIVLSIDKKKISYSERSIRWNLWNNFRNNCYNYDKKSYVVNILQSTFPLKEYSENNLIEKWGCNEDIVCFDKDIISHGDNIYSPIEIFFYAHYKPPLKWCEYMRKKGFMVTCYFLNLNLKIKNDKNQCGKCVYLNKRIIEELYTIPYKEIDLKYIDNLYTKVKTKKEYLESISKLKGYSKQIFFENGFCNGLCQLLDLYEFGPLGVIKDIIKNKDINVYLEKAEQELNEKKINEGEYLERCNILKELYHFKF